MITVKEKTQKISQWYKSHLSGRLTVPIALSILVNLYIEAMARQGLGKGLLFVVEKPVVFLLSDGAPTDNIDKGIAALKTVKTGTFVACAAGTSADTATLKKITEIVVSLDTADANSIKSFFKWVSSSISVSSQKIDLGKEVSGLDELPPPPPELKVVL